MTRLIALAGTALLLCACEKSAEVLAREEAANAAASENMSASAEAPNAAAPLGAAVSGEAAKKLMHDRHEGMEEIGDAMKPLSRTMKTDAPDLNVIRSSAATIARLAPQVSGWFPPGTGPDVGKTGAKPEIWQKPQDFAAKTKTFQQAAAAFDAAAKSGDMAAINARFGELGKSCKACHDLYREEDH